CCEPGSASGSTYLGNLSDLFIRFLEFTMHTTELDRRAFLGQGIAAGVALGVAGSLAAAEAKAKRTRVGVIGCGSVSRMYLPHLSECPFAELVSACDIIFERAE